MPFGVNSATGRPGPTPLKGRDGDKIQARQRINMQIRTGIRPHPNTLPCADCGHVYGPGESRHEYDHHLGYSVEHQLDVQAVCVRCHKKRDSAKANATHCIHGHEYTSENTGRKGNGTRFCRECRRARDRVSHNADYWEKFRERRKAQSGS